MVEETTEESTPSFEDLIDFGKNHEKLFESRLRTRDLAQKRWAFYHLAHSMGHKVGKIATATGYTHPSIIWGNSKASALLFEKNEKFSNVYSGVVSNFKKYLETKK
jgi:hypothetical protein